MYSAESTRALPRVGFPIRKSRDQRLVSISPGLIAAAHVLHRLLAPRHPPCALDLLIVKNTCFCHYGVFKVRASTRSQRTARRSLKTQQRTNRANTEFDIVLGELEIWTAMPSTVRTAHRSNRSGIPRKEVIQPQLPLRLPCYDFTPIINPTFDGSLPCGLGHRLRVLPTFVV
jgi:hypothetical protein